MKRTEKGVPINLLSLHTFIILDMIAFNQLNPITSVIGIYLASIANRHSKQMKGYKLAMTLDYVNRLW